MSDESAEPEAADEVEIAEVELTTEEQMDALHNAV